MKMLFNIILFSLITKNVIGANILFISPIDSTSHYIWIEVLIQGLLDQRHNITVLGYKEAKIKSENYTVHRMTGFEDLYEELDFENMPSNPFMAVLSTWRNIAVIFAERHLESDALKVILDYPRDKFDVIVFDIVSGQEFYPLIEYFGYPPVVGISPFGVPPYILDIMGSHFNFYYPYYSLPYTDNMTFTQRLENTLLYLEEYFLKCLMVPRTYKIAQARYGGNIATFDEIEKKIGILLANYDPVLDFPQPLPPNIIPVGGLHVKRSEKISNDLQNILDKANDGIIFFSFGTIIEPGWIPVETKRIFLKVFSKLKQTVLWKYAADDLQDVPKNVIIRKWYSQNDILAHKNVKLFITHSGALSTHETMYHGVPVLAMPFFADQKVIASKMAARKLGKQLLMDGLTEDILHETILEIINTPDYKENMQKTSRTFRDQKESPLERAIFWIEYALRNRDLNHLSVKARDMTLFQRENLDVYGVFLLCIAVTSALFFISIKCIINYLISKKKPKVKQY